jgi:AcrR family transcriptional regulator
MQSAATRMLGWPSMSIRVARKRSDAYQHGDLRRALIQAGLKLLGEHGVAGLSLRAAAQLAGVSHAAPYRHFRDKNALVVAIAEEGLKLLTRSMRAEIEACPSRQILARMQAAGYGYVSFALAHPAYFRTIFGEKVWPDRNDPAKIALVATGRESLGVLRALIDEGVRNGQLRAGVDQDQLALAAWSMVHGLSLLIIDGQLTGLCDTPAAVRAVSDNLARLLQRGIGG